MLDVFPHTELSLNVQPSSLVLDVFLKHLKGNKLACGLLPSTEDLLQQACLGQRSWIAGSSVLPCKETFMRSVDEILGMLTLPKEPLPISRSMSYFFIQKANLGKIDAGTGLNANKLSLSSECAKRL